MSLMDWLQKHLAGDEKAVLSKEEDSLSGLSLFESIATHKAWRNRLQSVLDGTSGENIDVGTVAQDGMCVLGKWLYGPGKSLYSQLPEYEMLLKAHSDFHISAGEVLLEQQNGNRDAAMAIMKGPFNNHSNKIQLDLVKLFTAAKR
ncbi:MAG TPA: CZB domain-containing protein [Gallionellaceae bacterium]